MTERTEPCRCLRDMLGFDGAGSRARCLRHNLFGEKQDDGRIVASRVPFPRLWAGDMVLRHDIPRRDEFSIDRTRSACRAASK